MTQEGRERLKHLWKTGGRSEKTREGISFKVMREIKKHKLAEATWVFKIILADESPLKKIPNELHFRKEDRPRAKSVQGNELAGASNDSYVPSRFQCIKRFYNDALYRSMFYLLTYFTSLWGSEESKVCWHAVCFITQENDQVFTADRSKRKSEHDTNEKQMFSH